MLKMQHWSEQRPQSSENTCIRAPELVNLIWYHDQVWKLLHNLGDGGKLSQSENLMSSISRSGHNDIEKNTLPVGLCGELRIRTLDFSERTLICNIIPRKRNRNIPTSPDRQYSGPNSQMSSTHRPMRQIWGQPQWSLFASNTTQRRVRTKQLRH